MNEKSELIFVYNASSTLLAQLKDAVHKVISPDTYLCNLCRVTYGVFEMKKEWREFIDSLPYKVTFLHQDEFYRQFPKSKEAMLPVIFKKQEEELIEFVSAQEINQQKTIGELKTLVLKKTANDGKTESANNH